MSQQAKRAKILRGPPLPNPVFNEEAQKQLWALRIKLVNKTVKTK